VSTVSSSTSNTTKKEEIKSYSTEEGNINDACYYETQTITLVPIVSVNSTSNGIDSKHSVELASSSTEITRNL
jgi:hypothetical protein